MPLLQIEAIDVAARRVICGPGGLAGDLEVREFPSGKLLFTLKEGEKQRRPSVSARARFSLDGKKVAATRQYEGMKKEGAKEKWEEELVVWDLSRPDTAHILDRRESKKLIGFAMFGLDVDRGEFGGSRFSPDSKRFYYSSADRKTLHVPRPHDRSAREAPRYRHPRQADHTGLPSNPAALALLVESAEPSQQPKLVLWDLLEKKALATRASVELSKEGQKFLTLAFSPDGQWLALGGGENSTIEVLGANELSERFRILDTSMVGVTKIFWTPDGELAVSGIMENLHVYRPEPRVLCDSFSSFHPAGKPVFSSDGKWLAVYSPSAPATASSFMGNFLADENAAALPGFDRIALVDRKTGQVSRFLHAASNMMGRLQFSPDGKRLIAEYVNLLVTYDTATGRQLSRKPPPTDHGISSWHHTFFLPDGRHAIITQLAIGMPKGGRDAHQLVLWDIASESVIHKFDLSDSLLDAHDESYFTQWRPLSTQPGRNSLRMGKPKSPGSDRLYELPTGRLIGELPHGDNNQEQIVDLAELSPKGERALAMHMSILGNAASVRDAYWTVRSLRAGEELLRIPNRTISEEGHAFSPDGRFVALAADKGHVEVWDIDKRELLFRWQPHGGKVVEYLSFSPEGDIYTIAQNDDRLMVLRMNEAREKLAAMGLGW